MHRNRLLPWILVFAGFAAVVVLLAVVMLRQLGAIADKPIEGAARIAGAFRSGNLTETFLSSIPRAADAGRGRLEVATLEATETLRREDDRRLVWDLLPLGTTVTELQVPVVYRYHLNLAEPWSVEVEGSRCRVVAPPLRATVPVAIRSEGVVKRVEQGWARFDGAEQLAALERSLTAHLTATARHHDRIALAREPARRTVAAFVQDWLLSHEAWRKGEVESIEVRFADEAEWGATTIRIGDPQITNN